MCVCVRVSARACTREAAHVSVCARMRVRALIHAGVPVYICMHD